MSNKKECALKCLETVFSFSIAIGISIRISISISCISCINRNSAGIRLLMNSYLYI